MNEPASRTCVLFVGESSGIRGLVTQGVPGVECASINSLNNIDVYFKAFPDRLVPVVVVDYMAATEGIGGGDTTMLSSRERLTKIKSLALHEGQSPRHIIGVSAHELWCTQLKDLGCEDAVGEASLISILEQAIKPKSA